MVKDYLKNKWRKLDNTAKIFSLESKSNTNVFRYSVVLKKDVNKNILLRALNRTLEYYSAFRVRVGSGFFWNYLEFNSKEPIVKEEDEIPCQLIDFKENNDYLFKVTYYKKKINLDIFHVLTDGVGAISFLKSLIYNYLDLRYGKKFKEIKEDNVIEYQDQYLKNFDESARKKSEVDLAYRFKGKIDKNVNNTYHYVINIDEIKQVCKKYGVSITEYLTALYIFSIYKSIYDRKVGREIIITVPINLRKYYQVETLSNFFACMQVNPRMLEKKITTFEGTLKSVHNEFKNKLSFQKVKTYLNRDVRLGMNLPIRLVPLFIKKAFIEFMCGLINRTVTSTVSNVGVIDIDDEYKKFIDNVYVLVLPGKIQKIKCTICSFNNNLNVTMNSNINDLEFERTFFELLKSQIDSVKVISNTDVKLLG